MKLGCHINLVEKKKKILLHRFINDSKLSYKSSRKAEKKISFI